MSETPRVGDKIRVTYVFEDVVRSVNDEHGTLYTQSSRYLDLRADDISVVVLERADTELDDEIEQILGEWLKSGADARTARNEICAAIAARGFDVYARRADAKPKLRQWIDLDYPGGMGLYEVPGGRVGYGKTREIAEQDALNLGTDFGYSSILEAELATRGRYVEVSGD